MSKIIKCAIVDDEPLAREGLENFVFKTSFLELVISFNSAIKALEYFKANSIDILFLDIQMPEMTGLEFMQTLPNPPQVIFTTAYREFAIDGFELNAVDYLLKPFSYNRFLKSVNKVLLHSKEEATDKDHIFIKCDKVIIKILLGDIIYIQAAKDYIFIHTSTEKYMTLISLGQIEERLPNSKFMRVHRSFIVGLKFVNKIEGNLLYINKEKIPISRDLRVKVYDKIVGNRLIQR